MSFSTPNLAGHNTWGYDIITYGWCKAHYANVRSPVMGKPMLSSSYRLFREGNDYVIKIGWRGTIWEPLCRITPNNTLVFEAPLDRMLHNNCSLSNILVKITGIHFTRWKKGMYRLGSEKEAATKSTSTSPWCPEKWEWLHSKAPLYFNGIKFNLDTGKCLNGKPDPTKKVIPEKRKEWLRDLKRYKRGLKTRAKVGALQTYIQAQNEWYASSPSWTERKNRRPIWSGQNWCEKLVCCMREETYPPEILKAFTASVEMGWHVNVLTDQHVLEIVDKIFTKHSEEFRREYGVFGETPSAFSEGHSTPPIKVTCI